MIIITIIITISDGGPMRREHKWKVNDMVLAMVQPSMGIRCVISEVAIVVVNVG